MRELAQRLLTLETGRQTEADTHAIGAEQVLEKLRASLARFAGPDGFASLLRRALKLARDEVPALAAVVVTNDGALHGFKQLAAEADDGGATAALAVTAHLLELLVVFVGETITFRLVRDVWPDAALSE